ncbi:MAG TPA: choice-of-anchor tandem repeat GloVer-containing protein [Candidatus Sulfotelmatobacter sp.]
MQRPLSYFGLSFLLLTIFAGSALAGPPPKVLHTFTGADGQNPAANLIADKTGNLYGTTEYGGAGGFYGTVFQLSPPAYPGGPWKNTTLYAFTNSGDGARPTAGLLLDKAGNLYGTTSDSDAGGYGEVFQLSPPATQGDAWTETVLYSFKGLASDGSYPHGALISDPSGNLFGTTETSVFELSPPAAGGQWTFIQLHAFQCCTSDGFNSEAGLVRDSAGALYGTTELGGFYGTDYCAYLGCGTVFKVSPPATKGDAWSEQVLYRFKSNIEGDTDGFDPFGGLILDSAGNLYGDTYSGGTLGGGTVFELSPPPVSGQNWTEAILHNFSYSATDGAVPVGSLIFDKTGALYGATEFGGNPCYFNATPYGCGTIFKLIPAQSGSWTETVLYFFTKGPQLPRQAGAGLYLDRSGVLYGTTTYGGDTQCSSSLASGCGTVFQFKP